MSFKGTAYQGHTKHQPKRIPSYMALCDAVDDFLARVGADDHADGYWIAQLAFSLSEETRTKLVQLAAGVLLKQRRDNPIAISFGPGAALELILAVLGKWRDDRNPIIIHEHKQAQRLIDQWIQEGFTERIE